jgi:hypothetical protein
MTLLIILLACLFACLAVAWLADLLADWHSRRVEARCDRRWRELAPNPWRKD